MPPPPIRFVVGVVGLWVVGRVVVLMPWERAASRNEAPVLLRRQEPGATSFTVTRLLPPQEHGGDEAPGATYEPRPSRPPPSSPGVPDDAEARAEGEAPVARPSTSLGTSGEGEVIAGGVADPPHAGDRRWSGDAYLFVRGGGGGSLAPGGQLGGGQAFARLNYRLAGGLAATVRVSRALHARDGEVAVGVAWQPVRGLRLLAERRIAVERGGRDAWSALAAGGVDAARIGPLRVDGYAQAGVVGLRSRDLFADGAVRVGREVGRLTLGAGLWGAAQPGVARLDVGPQAALRLRQVTVALDGRLRVAGNARPGSGIALTVASGF